MLQKCMDINICTFVTAFCAGQILHYDKLLGLLITELQQMAVTGHLKRYDFRLPL